ncbi:MAG TPA: DUF6265 family protein [Thermoanaerobaculia bacterium]
MSRLFVLKNIGVNQMKSSRLLLMVAAIFVALTAAAQEQLTEHTWRPASDSPRAAASVADLAWLEGHWIGEGLGGEAEEIWTAPRDSTMLGLFRLTREAKPVFYEIMSFMPDGESVVLRIKHFNRDLTGWEEKDQTVDFPFIARHEDDYRFRGLTFRRVSADELTIFLALKSKEGTFREERFVFNRKGTAVSAPVAE